MDATDPRWLVPMYLRDENDEPFVWRQLEQEIIDGTVELPVGNGNTQAQWVIGQLPPASENRKTGEPAGPLQQLWQDMSEELPADPF